MIRRSAFRIADGLTRALGYELVRRGVRGPLDEAKLRESQRQLRIVRDQAQGFVVREEFRDDSREHPKHYIDYECEFASETSPGAGRAGFWT